MLLLTRGNNQLWGEDWRDTDEPQIDNLFWNTYVSILGLFLFVMTILQSWCVIFQNYLVLVTIRRSTMQLFLPLNCIWQTFSTHTHTYPGTRHSFDACLLKNIVYETPQLANQSPNVYLLWLVQNANGGREESITLCTRSYFAS